MTARECEIRVSKKALKQLAEAIPGTDFMEATIFRETLVNKTVLMATWTEGDQRDETQVLVVIGRDGVVRL